MNNFEKKCFDFIADILINRPKNLLDEYTKYDYSDRQKIISIINSLKDELEENQRCLAANSLQMLNGLYNSLLDIINKGLI